MIGGQYRFTTCEHTPFHRESLLLVSGWPNSHVSKVRTCARGLAGLNSEVANGLITASPLSYCEFRRDVIAKYPPYDPPNPFLFLLNLLQSRFYHLLPFILPHAELAETEMYCWGERVPVRVRINPKQGGSHCYSCPVASTISGGDRGKGANKNRIIKYPIISLNISSFLLF